MPEPESAPGPWRVVKAYHGWAVRGADDWLVRDADDWLVAVTTSKIDADRIAAAPDMEKALEVMKAKLDYLGYVQKTPEMATSATWSYCPLAYLIPTPASPRRPPTGPWTLDPGAMCPLAPSSQDICDCPSLSICECHQPFVSVLPRGPGTL